jgi:hypothetical protein
MVGVVAVCAIGFWMFATIAGVTVKQVMDTVRDAALLGLAWFLYQRLFQGSHVESQPKPSSLSSL